MITLTENYQYQIKHYLENLSSNKDNCINMLDSFIKEYPNARGSSHNHQSYGGGYYKHISDIMHYAIMLYRNLPKLDFTLSDAILVLFLHDIEKPVKYGSKTFETDREIRNRLIKEFKIELTEEQYLALKYIHGEGDDYSKNKRIMSPLCAFCHCCDIISARIFFD